MTLMRFRAGTPAFYSAFQFGERRGGLLIAHPIYIECFSDFLEFSKRYYFLNRRWTQIDVDKLAFWASDLV